MNQSRRRRRSLLLLVGIRSFLEKVSVKVGLQRLNVSDERIVKGVPDSWGSLMERARTKYEIGLRTCKRLEEEDDLRTWEER